MRGAKTLGESFAKLPLMFLLATLGLCVISLPTSSGGSPKTSPAKSQPAQANLTSSLPATSTKTNTPEVKSTPADPQQEQSTDLSASYVPIPIAQAGAEGLNEPFGAQSGNDNEGAQSDSPGNTWTGPWPKKFQIGYIKQSDLHQVLIESLKGDPFGSLAGSGGSSAQAKSAQTTVTPQTSGPPKQMAVPKNQPEMPKIPIAQWPPSSQYAPMTLNKNFQNFREKMAFPGSRFTLPEMSFYSNHKPLRPFSSQPKQNLLQMANNFNNHRPQQFLFAGQSSFPKQHNNQPIYGISNFQGGEGNVHKTFQQPNQFGLSRPQKSVEYFSQWRPMTEDRPSSQQSIVVGKQPDYQTIHDGFDDGFNAPSKGAQTEGPSMSRHPMLNNYINSASASESPRPTSRPSPAVLGGVKTREAVKGGTKGGVKSADGQPETGTKSARENGNSLGSNRRRASNGTTSSTTTSTLEGTTETTTVGTSSLAEEPNSTTTIASTSSTGVGAEAATTTQASVTTTQAESDTTEPESESVDVDSNTEAGDNSTGSSPNTTTTTASSVEQSDASRGQDPQSKVASSGNERGTSESSQDSGEVATQSPVNQPTVGTASLPGFQSSAVDDSVSSTTSTTPSSSIQRSNLPPSSTTSNSNREETTPSSNSEISSTRPSQLSGVGVGSAKGEVEGQKVPKIDAMSDDALLAQTGSDIGKTSANQQQARPRASSTNNKKARSSERLVQVQQVDRKASSQTNKLITKKPLPAKDSGKRSAKQVNSGAGGVKGGKSSADVAVKGPKSAKKSSSIRRKSGGQKITRMAGQSERLQRPTQVVSMSAAQAQSTAQTLASLLLSRCLSSTGCSHLLDICTTKQAMVAQPPAESPAGGAGNQSLAWSTPVGLMSSSLMSLAQSLQADKVLKVFPQWREALENVVDQETQTGYTLILPSNEAIERLPLASLDAWLANSELMGQIIENHILDSAESLELTGRQSRVIRSKGLQVNQHRDRMVTINGKRVVYANQPAPAGGRIHVIDGVLDGAASGTGSKMLDIMDTLKQCDKFDGFVTLAEGTGLMQILKQDGPMTVFVPSNEALRKIPDEELDVIKNNNTALKEFLMYHVVNGSYFSQDLRDGQQLASILDMKPIQVGVRVDGCSRRLVEANTSPMRRPDIVAKNGVIHILDWYLTVRDNDWCDSMSGQQTASSTSNTMLPNGNSERLQQLGSEQNPSYTGRLALPANHKLGSEPTRPELESSLPHGKAIHQNGAQVSSEADGAGARDFGAKSIIITATPIGDQNLPAAA